MASVPNYYISFFNTMDPNDGTMGLPNWPKWSDGNELMHFWRRVRRFEGWF